LADGRLLTVETKIEVQSQVHELVSIAIDSAEKALVLFFDHAARQIEPNSAESIALLRRAIAVKMDYVRKLASAKTFMEATALQFAYCRTQVEITTDLIRIVSDSTDGRSNNPARAYQKLELDVLNFALENQA
jgi:hypothetical protein